MKPEIELIDRLVDGLLSDCKIRQPPVDPRIVCKRMGLKLKEKDHYGMNGITIIGSSIHVEPELPETLKNIVIGHELGHQFEKDFWDGELFQTSVTGERLCDLFSLALLLPTRWFAADCRRFDWNLFELKRRYSTAPYWAIAARWLAATDSPMVVSILDGKGKSLFRQSNGPAAVGWHPVERRSVAEAKRRKRPVRVRGDGVSVDVWPVSECGVRRVILSTVCMD